MTLSTGTKLSHYEITSQIGKGGMGEVYQAKDTKLGRDVAIKVLPEEFARDADRVARFQREAKLLASLNHPNIAAIYGLEESDGTHFLVMELIEGQTLDDRIKAGAIPVEEALKLALQIAEALEAAHEKGVIHRDLKPANIKVTPDGKVKVLDFGLAKAFAVEQADLNLSNSPTLSQAATMQGVILGTAAYMSPEQAKGKSVDKRSDIWAFGCVLFEMLTGKPAFQEEEVTEILASVVKASVNLDLIPANLNTKIHELCYRCLQKDLRKRYADISDVRYEIEQVLSDPSGMFVRPTGAAESQTSSQSITPWIVAILGILIVGVAVWFFKPTEPNRVIRFDYDLPEGQQFNNVARVDLAVSSDGNQIVYSAADGLYLRSMDEMDARRISGTDENPQSPFFSPNGQWIGYFSVEDQQLKIIPVSGGVAKILCGGTWIGGAVWRNDNTIIYGNDTTGIMRISADGGTPETLIEEKNYGGLFFPQLLPDGKSVLFNQHQSDRQSRIMVQSLQSDEPKDLGEGTAARYLPTGHIVYSSENSLFAVPFDIDSLEPTGIPIPIVEGVQYYQYAISESGTLIYKPGKSGDVVQKSNLVWVDRKGNEESIDAPLDLYSYPKISFDETRIVLTIGMRGYEDLWVWDINRKALSMLTSDEIGVGSSVWTPDSQRIIFSSNTQGTTNDIYWMAANGTGEIELLVAGQGDRLAAVSMPRDGSTLLMGKWGGGVRNDIESYLMEGEGERKPLLQEKYSEVNPQISPDGRWLAYMSNESGQYEVYVRSFPDVDGVKKQASTDGGFSPLWSPDSSELFFRNGNSVLAVKVKTEPNLELGAPEVLFNGTYSSLITPLATASNMWDIHPDGSRFLMMKPVGTAEEESAEESAVEEPRKINIILNWFEELKQKVPVP